MPGLLIRDIDVALRARVKQHAAARHRSLEEEVRELLGGAVTRQPQEEHIVDVSLRLSEAEIRTDLHGCRPDAGGMSLPDA